MAADNLDHSWWEYAPPAARLAAWPDFAETWFGETTTYPTGRGLTAPRIGWQCPGCQRCLSPAMRECPHCPEAKGTQPAVRELGDWEDEK